MHALHYGSKSGMEGNPTCLTMLVWVLVLFAGCGLIFVV